VSLAGPGPLSSAGGGSTVIAHKLDWHSIASRIGVVGLLVAEPHDEDHGPV